MTTIRKILITKKRLKRTIELKDWTMVEVERGYLKCLRELLNEEKGIIPNRDEVLRKVPTM